MRKLLPAMRVSLGLIMAVVSIILLSDLLGIIPDRTTAVIDGRKTIAETLAIQYSLAARNNDYDSIEASMTMLVERNEEVLSAALRKADGRLMAVVGDHTDNWDAGLGEKSTPTQLQVPIYKNATLKQKWGGVELRFTPTSKINAFGIAVSPLALMTVFVGVIGFLVFLLLIKKILTNIDPTAVMPSRVRRALDTLNEGVLLIDKKGRILFANEVFASATGVKEAQIIGKKAKDLGWKGNYAELPWMKTMKSGDVAVGDKVEFDMPDRGTIQFIVNSTPVLDDKGKQQGVMVTFDDVTELEEKNNELRNMVSRLKSSSEKINRQNEELRVLATHDPLTNCLNRRSLFGQFEEKCLDAIKNNIEFSCLMLDIDHFKHVNDTYGHAAGDEVLREVSVAIKAGLRGNDKVFRYGGEEFCVLLPDSDIKFASILAERVRENIEAQVVDGAAEGRGIRVTASFGLSSIKFGAENLPALIETADDALYQSKRNGRNQVTTWSAEVIEAEQSADAHHQVNVDEKPGTETDTGPLMNEHQDIDMVTGLPNRAHFRKELAWTIMHAQQHGLYAAVLLFDIDMFQRVNNVFGFTVGDTVLKTLAKRLAGAVRASDLACSLGDSIPEQSVYGLGGDEFGILLTGLESQDNVSVVVERLIDSLALPVIVNDDEVFLTCSVGVSQIPNDGTNVEELVTCANIALQQAKRGGKNGCQFFHKDFVSDARGDYEIENALRYALENDEFELYFQPQLDVQTLRIESMEALIRWHHPQRGLVMPGDFISAAETSGQIVDIGQWVINAACQQIRNWLDVGLALPVAVNLSSVQFHRKGLVEQINTAVSSARINPELLQLEITESMIMEHLDSALETMQALSRLGYKISIDDFGTGYSSLEYLKRFPVDNLKIDRAFIKDVDTDQGDAAIVRATISMAHSMDLRVVAEGVETEEQLIFLRNLRCDMIQGYLLGVPLPAREALALIDERQWQTMAS
jgi:diguanylate cyclase (GGDEF)-like protein/PAS domain S-box-containing protein